MLDVNSTLKMLDLFHINIEANQATSKLLEVFKKNPSIPGVILSLHNKFLGMISRKNFFEIMGRPFSLELFLNKPIENVYEELDSDSLVLPADALISDAMEQALSRPQNSLYEPIVVAFQDNHYEILDIDQLLIAQSRIYIQILEQLKKSISYVNNLLNNSGEGFLTFKHDLHIEPLFSKECIDIFKTNLENMFFPKLIFPDNEKQQNYLIKLLKKIFDLNSESQRKIYFPLLPEETNLGEKIISLKFKLIKESDSDKDDWKFMVILNDITERRNLENQIENERNILKMVVRVVVNYEDYINCVSEYKKYSSNLIKIIIENNSNLKDIIFDVYRSVHSFKGNFGQLEFVNTVSNLHNFESRLTEVIERAENFKKSDFIEFIKGFHMLAWLQDDMNILKKILGEEFFKKESNISIDPDRLGHIEIMINEIENSEIKQELIKEFNKIKARSFKDMLRSYPDYIFRLAEKYEKQVKIHKIEGEDILVDHSKYIDFCKSLVHVFRNIIEHGIESMDYRIEHGKEEYGNIKCNIHSSGKYFVLEISDDGYGIDIAKVKQKAVEKKLFKNEEINELSQEEILEIIFEENFSTKDNANELAGRGMGLSAVKKEVLKLNGKIETQSKPGEGTKFSFFLPIEDGINGDDTEILKIKQTILTTIHNYFKEIDLDLISIENLKAKKSENLFLKSFNSFVAIKSKIIGKIMISLEYKLAKHLMVKFFPDGISDEDENSFLEDLVSEVLNNILGNSTQLLSEKGQSISFGTPSLLKSEDLMFKLPHSKIWNYNILTSEGEFHLHLFSDN